MNKKGFTLIELLGVILIISLLVIIVLPRITNSVNNFMPKTDKLMMNMIEDAAKLYIEDNEKEFKESLYDYSCVPLTELVDKEYLKDGIEISGKDITKTKILKVTYDNDYKIELVNNNECIILEPGLYNENDVLLATWDELVEKGFDMESDFEQDGNSENIDILNSYGSKHKLVVDGSVTKIGNYSLSKCKGLIDIKLTNKVKDIGRYAFWQCSSLTSITIPSSVTSIGNYAFYLCGQLTSLTLSNSVTSIGNYAFGYCSKLDSIIVDENNPVYDSRDNSNAIIETATNTLIVGCKSTVIPKSVTSIGKSAFYYSGTLTSITIPSSVTSIGDYAFYSNGLTSITIPNSVTSIGSSTFSGCSKLESIVVEENNSVYDSRDNSNAIIETASNKLITGCNNTVIPNSVTSIGDQAFYQSGLTSIIIPNSVTSIGNNAFGYSRSLTNITISESVISIGSNAFNGCSKLTTIYYSGTATGSPWGAPSATVVPE